MGEIVTNAEQIIKTENDKIIGRIRELVREFKELQKRREGFRKLCTHSENVEDEDEKGWYECLICGLYYWDEPKNK